LHNRTDNRTPEPPIDAFRKLNVDDHVKAPETKQVYVTTMFDVIAPGYDRFTRLFSFGMDRGWKRKLVQLIVPLLPDRPVVLDLACGTGDICKAVASLSKSARVWGLDVSREMLIIGRRSTNAGQIGFSEADGMRLPTADSSADLVTVGYGLRNFPDCEAAVREIARVLKPGGLFACLDFYRPSNAVWREVYLGYLKVAGTAYSLVTHGHGPVFGYISGSIRRHLAAGEFTECLERNNFELEAVESTLLGGVCLHVARKRQ